MSCIDPNCRCSTANNRKCPHPESIKIYEEIKKKEWEIPSNCAASKYPGWIARIGVDLSTETQRKNIMKYFDIKSTDLIYGKMMEIEQVKKKNSDINKFKRKMFICGHSLLSSDVIDLGNNKLSLHPDAKPYSFEQMKSLIPAKPEENAKKRIHDYDNTQIVSLKEEAIESAKKIQKLEQQIAEMEKVREEEHKKYKEQEESFVDCIKCLFDDNEQLQNEYMIMQNRLNENLEKSEDIAKLSLELNSRYSSIEDSESLKELRDILKADFYDNLLEYNLAYVRHACLSTNNLSEYERLLYHIWSTRTSSIMSLEINTETGILIENNFGDHELKVFETKIKRCISTWLLSICNTHQRCAFLQELRDSMTHRTKEQHILDSGMGLSRSLTTRNRNRKLILNSFNHSTNEHICKKVEFQDDFKLPKKCILLFDDDFTRWYSHKYYQNRQEKTKLFFWTVICCKIIDVDCPVYDENKLNAAINNPEIISVNETVSKILDTVIHSSSFLSWIMYLHPEINSEEYLRVQSIRNRIKQHMYSTSPQETKFRMHRGMILIDILKQNFKSYKEMGRSILTQLSVQSIFNSLHHGGVIVSIGDFPKQHHERLLLFQGLPRNGGPQNLGKLLEECDPQIFADIVNKNGIDNDRKYDIIGKAAGNIYQILGPLHIKINPPEDFFTFWFHIIMEPLYCLATGKTKCSKSLHLREKMNYLEALFSQWVIIRIEVKKVLNKYAWRFDASAFLHFFEESLPLSILLYDCVFKNSEGRPELSERYFEGLCHQQFEAFIRQRKNYRTALLYKIDQYLYITRTNHCLKDLFMNHLSTNDEVNLEGGVNSRIASLVRNVYNEDEAISRVKEEFSKKTNVNAVKLRQAFMRDYPYSLGSGRKIEELQLLAGQIIVEVVEKIVQADNKLPVRVKRPNNAKFTCDVWECSHLSRWDIPSYQIGSVGYCLFNGKKNNLEFAPDKLKNNCSLCRAPKLDTTAEYYLCGHWMCVNCQKLKLLIGFEFICGLCAKEADKELKTLAQNEKNSIFNKKILISDLHNTFTEEEKKEREEEAEISSGNKKPPPTQEQILFALRELSKH